MKKKISTKEISRKKASLPTKGGKSKRKSLLTYFAFAMILIGVLILLYPIAANYLANRERSEATANYSDTMENMSEEERDAQLELAEKYNTYIYQKQQEIEAVPVDYKTIMRGSTVMGTLDIPAIDIEGMPFYQGTDYLTLDKGLGHYEPTSIPIGGDNTRGVITGHSGVRNQVLFSDVKNLKEGDIFFINILGKRLAYEIFSFEEIMPDQVDRVDIQQSQDLVTLLTCTPPGINTYRLLVTGRRIDYQEAQAKEVVKRNQFSYQNVVLTSLAINLAIFLFLFLVYRYLSKKRRSPDKKVARKAAKRIRKLLFATKIMFATLFVAMLAVLGFAIYGYFAMQQNNPLETIQVGEQEELASYNYDKIFEADYGERQIASVNVADYANARQIMQQTTNDWGIGKLVIPAVNIDLPILAGLANQNLLTGAATYRQTQQLGKGNYVLLAHNIYNNYNQNVLLNPIHQLELGDKMYATDFQNIFVYEVTLNELIVETEVQYIEETDGDEAILTLFRCEGDIGTKYRQLVQGKLTDIIPVANANTSELAAVNLSRKTMADEGELLTENPISKSEEYSMMLAARILSDPLQTVLPIFLLFLIPIIFFSLI